MDRALVKKLRCVTCGGIDIHLESDSSCAPSLVSGTLICAGCGREMPVRDGILENSPFEDGQLGMWDDLYKAQSEDMQGIIENLRRGFEKPEALRAFYDISRVLGALPERPWSSVELGCGSGAFSLVLLKLGLVGEVTLLDYSLQALRIAELLFSHFGESCNLVHAAIESHPFRDGAFDISLSGGVIEHHGSLPERLACMKAHVDVAGLTYVQAPVDSPFYWVQRTGVTVLRGGWPFGYERPLSMREVRLLAHMAGADILCLDYHFFLSRLAFKKPSLTLWRRLYSLSWFTRLMRTEVGVLAAKRR